MNPRTSQPCKKKQSGAVRVEWPEELRDKKKGIYRVRIENGGKLIIVRDVINMLRS